MKAIIENTAPLTNDEIAAVRAAIDFPFADLNQAEAELLARFPTWFVYRGGSHVALHRNVRDERRVVLVTE